MSQSLAGGWSITDTHSQTIQDIAKWAIETFFHLDSEPTFTVIYAEKQVVAGMNYKIIMDVLLPTGSEMWGFIVYDRFGQGLTITQSAKISG
jgi:hypothetical protein